jgi:hypothetical protein
MSLLHGTAAVRLALAAFLLFVLVSLVPHADAGTLCTLTGIAGHEFAGVNNEFLTSSSPNAVVTSQQISARDAQWNSCAGCATPSEPPSIGSLSFELDSRIFASADSASAARAGFLPVVSTGFPGTYTDAISGRYGTPEGHLATPESQTFLTPEPGTALLLAFGLLGTALLYVRRMH